MASVMAIGSVAVVASADETAAATTQVKTKADLEAYVKESEDFANKDIDNYGSVSSEEFANALTYAQNVVEATDSTVDDYTVAYAMLEAVRSKMKQYSAEELQELINQCKKTYETDNVYSEDLNDARFTEDTWDDFVTAYEDAESVLKSSDIRVITDAFEVLTEAKQDLAALSTVTKSQFRTTLKAYETILQKEFAYDSWRRGKTGWGDLRILDLQKDGSHVGSWTYYGQTISYGVLYEYAKLLNDEINAAYERLDSIKSVDKTSDSTVVNGWSAAQDIVEVFNSWTPDDTTRGTKAAVKKLISEYQGCLVNDYATTAAENLYDMVVEAVGKENLHNRVADGYSSKIDTDIPAVTSASKAWLVTVGNSSGRKIDAELSLKTDVEFYMIQDADGNVTEVTKTKPNQTSGYTTIRAKSEVDLTDYIVIKASDIKEEYSAVDNHATKDQGVVDGGYDSSWSGYDKATPYAPSNFKTTHANGTSTSSYPIGGVYVNSAGETVCSYTTLDTAMKLAMTYLGGNKEEIAASDIYYIDTTDGIVAGSAKGSSAEWTLVYRYLKYALSDKYTSAGDGMTKADVEDLIEKSYKLADDTGDAALFAVKHNALVEARQDALAWVKAANKDKKYKDNTTYYEIANGNGKISGEKIADEVYNTLDGFYSDLNKEYGYFKYSFGEIYNKISDVKAMIDDGELEANDALVGALSETSYYLSVVKALSTEAGGSTMDLDNDAFTTDGFFNDFNRVYSNTSTDNVNVETAEGRSFTIPATFTSSGDYTNSEVKSHYELLTAYEALLAEVKAQTEPTVTLGDVNGDGVVNALDASDILKYVVGLGTLTNESAGDFNADGKIDALDASAILKSVVGLA